MDVPQKQIVVNLTANPADAKTYDVFLMKTDEEYLEIQLCTRAEDKDTVTFDVKEIFKIAADSMFPFCMDLVQALVDYEQKYRNQKGWPNLPESDQD